jgi:hypothetical protein
MERSLNLSLKKCNGAEFESDTAAKFAFIQRHLLISRHAAFIDLAACMDTAAFIDLAACMDTLLTSRLFSLFNNLLMILLHL